MKKYSFLCVLVLCVSIKADGLIDQFGNVVDDFDNPLFQGQFYDRENNPLWHAFKDGVQDKQIYRKLGVSEEDTEDVFRAQQVVKRALDVFFRQYLITPYQLFATVLAYTRQLEYIENKYLFDVSNVLAGTSIKVQGNNNFLRGNNLKVRGMNNYVLDGRYAHKTVRRNNILRIGRYEIDLNRINKIRVNPHKVIKILGVS